MLNEQQKEAVLHIEGPLLILAGAGSGKTNTMTHRIAYMIEEKGVSPYEILAVTFTNKAATEMKQRVEHLIGANFNIWMTTFHSACMRILRQQIEALGYSKDFTIYDSTDQKTVIKECIKQENLDEKVITIPYVQKIIGDCKDKGVSPKEYEKPLNVNTKEYKIAKVYERYENTLKKNNALDFDDLILKTVQLFEKFPEILEHYQNRFKYIMVDEYQDTNYMQYRFVYLLAQKNKNICVVGDDDQCIYQWRGADIRNILDFEKDFSNTKIIKLEQNYRSTSNILDGAHSVIQNNSGRKRKKLWTSKEEGQKINCFRGMTEKDEGMYIAREIERQKGIEMSYSDFSILYRTHAQSRSLEEALSIYDIPYRIFGGLRFYDRKEVKDLLAYLKLVQNPVDELSIKRVINEPKRGIGLKTMEKISNLAAVRNEDLFHTMLDEEVVQGLSAKISKGIKNFTRIVSNYHSQKDELKVSEIYEGLLDESGYIRDLEAQNTVESKSRIENLMELKSVIYEYEQSSENPNLFEFLEKIALVTDIDNYDPSVEAVLLMTLHSAKGLEFPVVFMPGMEEGLFPGRRAFDSQESLEEERRLCYVGMTRAKERLHMSHADQRMLYGRTEYTKVSRFMGEIDQSLLEGFEPVKEKPKRNQYYEESRNQFSPFHQMKTTKNGENRVAKSHTTSNNSSSQVSTGDKVKHKTFGEGLVVSLEKKDNTMVTIVFDKVGIKTLALEFAPLEKIG